MVTIIEPSESKGQWVLTKRTSATNTTHRLAEHVGHSADTWSAPDINIPLEIQEHVLDMLLPYHGDPLSIPRPADILACYAALRAFCLTCQTWLPRARRHLYTFVYLPSDVSYYLLVQTLRIRPDFVAFVRWIHFAALPNAVRYQWNKQLVPTRKQAWHLFPFQLICYRFKQLEGLYMGATHLERQDRAVPNKSTLSNRYGDTPIGPLTSDVFLKSCREFSKSLGTLCLGSTAFSSFSYFVRLVTAFPRIHTLQLFDCMVVREKDMPRDAVAAHPVPRTRLENLRRFIWSEPGSRSDNNSSTFFLLTSNWLINSGDVKKIEELIIMQEGTTSGKHQIPN